MNKGLYKLFTSCAAIVMSVAAHAASLNLGYCFGEIADEGISKVGNATIEGAVVLSEEMLAPYIGAKVTGIRVGLVTAEGVDNLQGWIRDSLEGDNLDVASGQAVTGWNDIALSGEVVLTGAPVVAGFSFSQEKAVKCISVVGENNDDARWIAKNGKWEQAKKEGVLSVELVISSDNLPERDLEIVALSSSSLLPCPHGENIMFEVGVRNRALTPVSAVDLVYCLNDGDTVTQHYDVSLDYGQTAALEFNISPEGLTPDVPYLLKVKAICEEDDVPENNVTERYIGWYTECYDRKVLVEEFTTEQCANCPRAINTLKQCENAGYGDRMNVVAHHVGYYVDWLTVDGDETYLWLFDPTGQDGTFAPAVMLDRTVLEGSSVPVNSIGYFVDFEPVLKKAIDIPAFVNLDVACSSEDENVLDVTVVMERMPLFNVLSENSRLTVYLIEDEIPHLHQAGINSDSFTHSHVYRACLTDLWGDKIDWTDNQASNHYSIPFDEKWNRDNLSIVAFVNDYDPDNVAACQVYNSANAHVADSGIGQIGAMDIVDESYYTLSGICISNPTDGIYLHRLRLSDGSVRFEKIVCGNR
ncbi:MAG: Omp28-related outer membrane protein [Muribaculaceae bacterium]|nr:Omp28-related outer membrane protein [Muribaculaceae bacterium]